MTVKEMLEKRAKLVTDARGILDKADKEKRDLTAEERKQYDDIYKDVDAMKGDIDRYERQAVLDKEMADAVPPKTGLSRSDGAGAEPRKVELRKSCMGDTRTITIAGPCTSEDYASQFRAFLLDGPHAIPTGAWTESRSLQKDAAVSGGYLSAPIQFQAELIQAVDNAVFMRQISRVLPPISTADTLGAPSLDADPADPTWVSELNIGAEDTTLAFGKRELTPHPLAQFIKVSNTLLRRSVLNAETIVRDRLAYKIGVVEENAFLNGSGSNQPLGVFTASDDGIGTARDVSTGNTSTEIRTDGLIEAQMSLKAPYRQSASTRWLFHRSGIKQIRKLKDGEGRYIWQASLLAGQPDTLLGHGISESEYVPSTFTTGLYVGILGDFRFYWIVDALTLQIQKLVELYAGTNQSGYISRIESDGMPVLAEAFARVKLG